MNQKTLFRLTQGGICLTYFLMLFCSPHMARATISRSSSSLPKIVSDADIIVVAQVIDYTADSYVTQDNKNSKTPRSFSARDFSEASKFQRAGLYHFKVHQCIKGQCDSDIQLHLDNLNNRFYGYGGTAISKGSWGLLLLVPSSVKSYEPADPSTPLIILSSSVEKLVLNSQFNSDQQIYSVLLDSLRDETFRRSVVFHLRSVRDNRVADELSSYVRDADIEIKDNALYCMLVNQRIEFIPDVLKLSEELWDNRQSPDCLLALQKLKVAEATPILNKMLFEKPYYVRLNAIFALFSTGDRTSVPYLLSALNDPDPQRVIPYYSYRIICRIIPSLGRPKTEEYFYSHREEETGRVYKWWPEYLSSKRNQISNSKTSLIFKDDVMNTQIADHLDLLYDRYVNVRKGAIKSIGKFFDSNDIPYLLLCLHDPDAEVAFNSYALLRSMINQFPKIGSAQQFEKERTDLTRLAYSWWSNQLAASLSPKSQNSKK